MAAGSGFCDRCGAPLAMSAVPSMAAPTYFPPPEKKSRKKLWIGVVVVVLVVIAAVAAVALANHFTPQTIAAAGTTWTVPAGDNAQVLGFSITQGATISGSWTATAGIFPMLADSSEYAGCQSSLSTCSGMWSGPAGETSGSISFAIQSSGTYYLMFINTNLITPTTVQVVGAITLQAS